MHGCDFVVIRVDKVVPSGHATDQPNIKQMKPGRPLRFELTDQTRLAIDEHLRLTGRKPGPYLFAGRGTARAG